MSELGISPSQFLEKIKKLEEKDRNLTTELMYLRNLQVFSIEMEKEFQSASGDIYKFLLAKFALSQKQNAILKDALSFYADPYNYTPNLDAMYGKNLNERAFKVLEEIKRVK